MATVETKMKPLVLPGHLELASWEGPLVLPGHLDLPSEDGSFVKNNREHPQSILITEGILPVLRRVHPDGMFAIGQDSGIYYREADPPSRGAKCPDWYYVPDVPPTLDGEYRRSYVLWKELIPPRVILEFSSDNGAEERDTTPVTGKFWVYERVIRPAFYGIFIVETGEFEAYRSVGGIGSSRCLRTSTAISRSHASAWGWASGKATSSTSRPPGSAGTTIAEICSRSIPSVPSCSRAAPRRSRVAPTRKLAAPTRRPAAPTWRRDERTRKCAEPTRKLAAPRPSPPSSDPWASTPTRSRVRLDPIGALR